MDTINKKLILDCYFCFKSGPVFFISNFHHMVYNNCKLHIILSEIYSLNHYLVRLIYILYFIFKLPREINIHLLIKVYIYFFPYIYVCIYILFRNCPLAVLGSGVGISSGQNCLVSIHLTPVACYTFW